MKRAGLYYLFTVYWIAFVANYALPFVSMFPYMHQLSPFKSVQRVSTSLIKERNIMRSANQPPSWRREWDLNPRYL